MEEIQIPPTPEIKQVCILLEELIHRFLRPPTPYEVGEFEYKAECLNLLALIIRDVESITTLGKCDLVLLPSAMNLTRSVLEKAVRILWMLDPSDPFDREVRWLAHLHTEENYYDRISNRMIELGIDNQQILKNRETISEFRRGITEVLPKPYKPMKEIPNLSKMMKDIGEADKYPTYILLSQYVHGTHVATGTYRKGLGNAKELGEYISPDDWAIIFDVCKYFLIVTTVKFNHVITGEMSTHVSVDLIRDIETEIAKIEKTKNTPGLENWPGKTEDS
jgi:hypothetical protein